MNTHRDSLPHPIPARIARLPIDGRGYPVPWFVAKVNGAWDFRMADPEKFARCVRESRCWICGDVMGAHKTFVAGPIAAINRCSSEPPSHRECAEWACRACPFIVLPKAKRRGEEWVKEHAAQMPGEFIERNPGVYVTWTTHQYGLVRDRGGILVRMGAPEHVDWWRGGAVISADARVTVARAAIDEAMPLLQRMCVNDQELRMLLAAKARALHDLKLDGV